MREQVANRGGTGTKRGKNIYTKECEIKGRDNLVTS